MVVVVVVVIVVVVVVVAGGSSPTRTAYQFTKRCAESLQIGEFLLVFCLRVVVTSSRTRTRCCPTCHIELV